MHPGAHLRLCEKALCRSIGIHCYQNRCVGFKIREELIFVIARVDGALGIGPKNLYAVSIQHSIRKYQSDRAQRCLLFC